MGLWQRFLDEQENYRDLGSKPRVEQARALRRLMLMTAALSVFTALNAFLILPLPRWLGLVFTALAVYCLFMAWLVPRKLRDKT
jgi:hypothetical protein